MQDLLSQTFYGNTVSQWAVALGIAVGAFLLGKIVYWLTSGVLRRVTANTETRLDDIIVDMVDEPLVVIVTVFGLRVAIATLELPTAIQQFLANAVQGVTVLAVAWMVVRMFEAFLKHVVEPAVVQTESDLDDQLLPVLRKAGKTGIWALGIIMALNNAGYDVAALIAGLGLGGLALAMAAQDTVKNVFGGFTIFTDQPFKLNDRIVVNGFDGVVKEIGIRTIRIRTLAGREVTMPNSSIAGSAVENITSEPSRKVILTLGLTYDTAPEAMQRAMDILREIHEQFAEDTDGEPVIAFNGFGDFSMNLLFIYYIRSGADILGTQTGVNLAILQRFNAEGLGFAFPTQTIEFAAGAPWSAASPAGPSSAAE